MIRLAWRNLFRNPRRTLASLFTVAFGAAGLLIYQGFNEGIMNTYRDNTIRVRYGHGQLFPHGYRDKVLEKPWTAWIENFPEVESKLKAIPEIKSVFPRIRFYSFLTKGGITLAGRGEGVLPERENKFFTAMNFVQGHDLQAGDEVILGIGLARSLDAKVGDTLTLLAQTVNGQLNGADLRVAGIFHTGAQDFDDSYFRINLDRAQALLDTKRIELIVLETTGVAAWPQVEARVHETLPQLDAYPFHVLDKIYYQNAVDFLQAQFSFIRLIILVIVGLGIFNIVAVGMLERSQEIGALRANGESRRRLTKILLTENAFLGLLGGALGIVVALALNYTLLYRGIPMPPGPGITRQFLIKLAIEPMHFVEAIALPLVTAVVAGIWPVRDLLKRSIPDLLKSV